MLITLKKRYQFQNLTRHAMFAVTPGFVLQYLQTPQAETHALPDNAIRFGLTASGKIGNAVKRNRCKRRLRALVRQSLPAQGQTGTDYVLVARARTDDVDFSKLSRDLRRALDESQRKRPQAVMPEGAPLIRHKRKKRRKKAVV